MGVECSGSLDASPRKGRNYTLLVGMRTLYIGLNLNALYCSIATLDRSQISRETLDCLRRAVAPHHRVLNYPRSQTSWACYLIIIFFRFPVPLQCSLTDGHGERFDYPRTRPAFLFYLSRDELLIIISCLWHVTGIHCLIARAASIQPCILAAGYPAPYVPFY